MVYRIGLYNKAFQMASVEILEERAVTVRDRVTFKSSFKISAGPLIFNGETYKDLYVVEVDYKMAEHFHRQELPLQGFGSNLCDDYMETATRLAEEFCLKNNFKVHDLINSWPEYQAVVQRKN